MTMDDSPERDDAHRDGRRRNDASRPYEPVRFGRSPLHRMPTVSVIAFAVIVVIVASATRGPVRWFMLAVILVASLSAWRAARARRASSDDDEPPAGTTPPGDDHRSAGPADDPGPATGHAPDTNPAGDADADPDTGRA
ncbi:hypothetical protein ACPYO6_15620 [Georgenia sp. Z1344]|uniref:hypothetical protein n=1 Tax=Georgenia sp. Z1344 TaxID=3416706 RepID=UPI003CEA5784